MRRDPESDDCEKAINEESRTEQGEQIRAKTEWLQKGAVVESQLAAYFPGTELSRQGKAYINAVRIYLFLASTSAARRRKRREAPPVLRRGPGRPSVGRPRADAGGMHPEVGELGFREIYGPMGTGFSLGAWTSWPS